MSGVGRDVRCWTYVRGSVSNPNTSTILPYVNLICSFRSFVSKSSVGARTRVSEMKPILFYVLILRRAFHGVRLKRGGRRSVGAGVRRLTVEKPLD